MKKRIFIGLLVVAMVLTGSSTAMADKKSDANDAIDNAEANLDDVNDQMSSLQKQQEEIQARMDAEQAELSKTIAQVDLLKQQVTDKEGELAIVQENLKKAQEDEAKQYEAMKLRIQYMYEKGDANYLEAVFNSDSIANMVNQSSYYEDIYTADRKMLTDYQQAKTDTQDCELTVTSELAELETAKAASVSEQEKLETIVANLNVEAESKATQLANAQNTADQYVDTINEQKAIIQAEDARIAKEVAAIRKAEEAARKAQEAIGGYDPTASTEVNAANVIAYAEQFMGTPYVWGGNSLTKGLDCSGFTKAVFGHFGITLNRYSQSQALNGQEVSRENIQPGDIIIYSISGGYGHVAIYIGNDCILHSSYPQGINIKQGAFFRDIVAIRRVL